MIRGGAAPPAPGSSQHCSPLDLPHSACGCGLRLAPLSLPVPQKPSSPAPCKEVITPLSHPRTFLKRKKKKIGMQEPPCISQLFSPAGVLYIYMCVYVCFVFLVLGGGGVAFPSPPPRFPAPWMEFWGGQVGLWGAEGEGSVSFPRPSFSFFYWFVVCSSWLCRFLILHQGFF